MFQGLKRVLPFYRIDSTASYLYVYLLYTLRKKNPSHVSSPLGMYIILSIDYFRAKSKELEQTRSKKQASLISFLAVPIVTSHNQGHKKATFLRNDRASSYSFHEVLVWVAADKRCSDSPSNGRASAAIMQRAVHRREYLNNLGTSGSHSAAGLYVSGGSYI